MGPIGEGRRRSPGRRRRRRGRDRRRPFCFQIVGRGPTVRPRAHAEFGRDPTRDAAAAAVRRFSTVGGDGEVKIDPLRIAPKSHPGAGGVCMAHRRSLTRFGPGPDRRRPPDVFRPVDQRNLWDDGRKTSGAYFSRSARRIALKLRAPTRGTLAAPPCEYGSDRTTSPPPPPSPKGAAARRKRKCSKSRQTRVARAEGDVAPCRGVGAATRARTRERRSLVSREDSGTGATRTFSPLRTDHAPC